MHRESETGRRQRTCACACTCRLPGSIEHRNENEGCGGLRDFISPCICVRARMVQQAPFKRSLSVALDASVQR